MNSMQDRLTGALDAAAQTVRPQTLRPLREPRRARRGRWDARFAPAAAAIGVALVVAVALVVTSGQQRTTGSGPASARPQARGGSFGRLAPRLRSLYQQSSLLDGRIGLGRCIALDVHQSIR